MAAKEKAEMVVEPRYFIVNPAGVIHEVNKDHAQEKLRLPGWRQATLAEVKELVARGGNQRFDDPICEPWNPEPEPIVGLEEIDIQQLAFPGN